MKLNALTGIISMIMLSVFLLANADGRAEEGSEGATGAPNDNPIDRTCQNCHNNSSTIQVTLDIEVRNENQQAIIGYAPGETYDVFVRINSVGSQEPSAHGFQMVCLTDSDLSSTKLLA